MEGKITITKKRYLDLIIIEETLNRLNAGGVDDWNWYYESLNPDDSPDLEEFKKVPKLV